MNAKLWEDTVVTAMRDEKWLHCLRHRSSQQHVPLPQLKIQGRAEQRLGDIVDFHDDRFFLFEVKGTRDDIASEWTTNNESNEHQKSAFRAHRLWRSRIQDKFDVEGSEKALWRSLRGHFFAYWGEFDDVCDEETIDSSSATASDFLKPHNSVVVEPYLAACASMSSKQPANKQIVSTYHVAYLAALDCQIPRFYMREQIPLSLVYEGWGHLVATDLDFTTIDGFCEIGLSLEEMKDYISALCATAGDAPEPVHAVLLSSSGRFFRVMTDTKQLWDVASIGEPSAIPTLGKHYTSLPMTDDVKRNIYQVSRPVQPSPPPSESSTPTRKLTGP